jgi:hypothetical protein
MIRGALTDERAIEAKAQAELAIVLATTGVKYADLTQFERFIWTAGYKAGHARGAKDGIAAVREELRGIGAIK